MFRFVAPVLLCALAMGGCASKPAPRLVQFDEAEYAWSAGQGTGSIVGQAFLRTKSGDVKYGAAQDVLLSPVTSYSTEVYQRRFLNGENIENADPRMEKYIRTAVADGDGRFRFDGLPAGDYYISCTITWYVTQYAQTGGVAHARVTVKDGQTTNAIVTRR